MNNIKPTNDDFFKAEVDQQSTFNMAFDYLRIVHWILYKCNQEAEQNNLIGWYKQLEILHRNLIPMMSQTKVVDEEDLSILKLVDKKKLTEYGYFKRLRSNCSSKYDDYQKKFNNFVFMKNRFPHYANNFNLIMDRDFYNALDVWESELRKLIKKRGMLLPVKEDTRFAI